MGLYDRDYVRGNSGGAALQSQVSFTNQVYSWMSIGLGLTAIIAYSLFASGLYVTMMPFWWVFALGTFGLAMAMGSMLDRISFPAAAGLFLGYAALEGMFFGVTLPLYAAAYGGGLIWVTFATASFICASAIGYGALTKSDLTELGRLLNFGLMALIGITFLYFILSFFVTLTWMHLLISYMGLGIFIGLTAYDAQQIRQMSQQMAYNQSTMSMKLALIMALKMYINVIMVFWYLLQIFASRRD